MESGDLGVFLELSSYKCDLQKSQLENLWITQKMTLSKYFRRIGMNLRLRWKITLSWNISVDLE